MKNEIKEFGWKRNIDYILSSLSIGIKRITEYKINLYMAILNNAGFVFVQILFLGIINSKFNDFVGWTLMEYIFFIIFFNLLFRLFGTFFFHSILRFDLLNGKINSYLTKPINVFMQYILTNIPVQAAFMSIIYFIALIIYIIHYSQYLNFLRLFLLIPFGLLCGIFGFTSVRLLDSTAFLLNQINFY